MALMQMRFFSSWNRASGARKSMGRRSSFLELLRGRILHRRPGEVTREDDCVMTSR